MLHQLRVSPDDCGPFRIFGWPDDDVDQEQVKYRMEFHFFGANIIDSLLKLCSQEKLQRITKISLTKRL